MTRILRFLVVSLLVVSAVSADQYWIAYEGNDFPENEGWWHIWGGGTAERWIEDGTFVLDTLHDPHIADFYQMNMYGSLDPEPGELFVMHWRLRVDETIGPYDVGVSVYSDEKWAAAFLLDEDTIFSVFETGVSASFASGVFHEFELRSPDMQTYELFIDDALAIEGTFWLSLTESQVIWGDKVQGAASLSRWDYVRFGVVPEPSSACQLGVGMALLSALRRIT